MARVGRLQRPVRGNVLSGRSVSVKINSDSAKWKLSDSAALACCDLSPPTSPTAPSPPVALRDQLVCAGVARVEGAHLVSPEREEASEEGGAWWGKRVGSTCHASCGSPRFERHSRQALQRLQLKAGTAGKGRAAPATPLTSFSRVSESTLAAGNCSSATAHTGAAQAAGKTSGMPSKNACTCQLGCLTSTLAPTHLLMHAHASRSTPLQQYPRANAAPPRACLQS